MTMTKTNAASAVTGDLNEVAADVAMTPREQREFDRSKVIADKLRILGTVRQGFAEAKDLFDAADGSTVSATEIADRNAVSLYQAKTAGYIQGEEISAVLGDIFGYKPKKDGKPGKTPAGQGEAIRKRIVRAISADDYVQNGDGGQFFEGLPEDEIEGVLNAVHSGSLSLWTAYERFAEIKRDHVVKTEAAFDPKRIAALVEALSQDGSSAIVNGNPALLAVYDALTTVLNIITNTPIEE